MEVLVTGAAGRLGRVLVEALLSDGHAVTATDCGLHPEMPVPLEITDLTDRLGVYRLMSRGYDAVVHAGNHPHPHAAKPADRLLADNMAMNAHVFWSALAVGVQRIVFISSIQAMVEHDPTRPWWQKQRDTQDPAEYPTGVPELPLHGGLPGLLCGNSYGMSKVFGEQALTGLTKQHEGLRAVSLRLAWVVHAHEMERRFWRVRRRGSLRQEAGAYIDAMDVARACGLVLERAEPGHEVGFLGRTPRVEGMSDEQVCAEVFPEVPVRGPVGGPGGLVDLSRERELWGWEPSRERYEVRLEDAVTQTV